jgi:drug/metabolite transporter (DMT)-like permease
VIGANAWPYLGLLCNALVWGVSWWPMRQLGEMGLHPLWATVIIFALSTVMVTLWHPGAWRALLRHPELWVLALASGATNAAFNWAVSVGDVVRVVLLFYLMPVWAVPLAWWLLGERITPLALGRVLLAMAGAFLVLMPGTQGWPTLSGLADVLGLLGGLGFALTNVMLRRLANEQSSARALAMFAGGTFWPLLAALGLWQFAVIGPPPEPHWGWMLGAALTGLAFLGSNLALQYGASKLSVHTTSVVMLTEIVFATVSSIWWGSAVITPLILLGGGLIMLSALWTALTS